MSTTEITTTDHRTPPTDEDTIMTYTWTFAYSADGIDNWETLDHGTTDNPETLANAEDTTHYAHDGATPAPGTYRVQTTDEDGNVISEDTYEVAETPRIPTADVLRAYVGDHYDELEAKIGTDGIADLTRVLDDLTDRYGDPEDPTQDAWLGAVKMAYGDVTLAELAAKRATAHRAYEDAQQALLSAIAYAAEVQRVPEAELVRVTGLSRMTVRKAMGR